MEIPENAIIRDSEGNPLFFSISRMNRDKNLKIAPKYNVGDIVVLTITCEVESIRRDCDGSPLYDLSDGITAISEDSLRVATDEEKRNY